MVQREPVKECPSWEEFEAAIKALPDGNDSSDVLFLKGYGWPQFNGVPLPPEIPALARDMVRMAADCFSMEKIFPIESPRGVPDPNRKTIIYEMLAHICDGCRGIGYADMKAEFSEDPFEPSGIIQLNFRLPVDRKRLPASTYFLRSMWDYIRGVELAFPEGCKQNCPIDRLEYILLVQNGKIVTSGHDSLYKLGQPLPKKRLLVAGHAYP
jgi:hypothetical protein